MYSLEASTRVTTQSLENMLEYMEIVDVSLDA